MRSIQKISLSLLVAVITFTAFALFAFSGLFEVIESSFYSPRVLEQYQKLLNDAAEDIRDYQVSNLERFQSIVQQDEMRTVFSANQSRADIQARERMLSQVAEEQSGFGYARVIDREGDRLHFSTWPDDYQTNGNERTYRAITELDDELQELPLSNDESADVVMQPDEQRFIYRIPVEDENGIHRGTALFYFSPRSLTNRLTAEGLIESGRDAVPIGSRGFLLNVPRAAADALRASVEETWESITAGAVGQVTGDGTFVVPVEEHGDYRVGYLVPSGELSLGVELKGILLTGSFLTVFLLTFLLLNIRQDSSVVLSERVKRFQIQMLKEYLERREDLDWEARRRELMRRKPEMTRRIKRGIGKVRPEEREQLDELVEKGWDEIVDVIGSRGGKEARAGIDMKQLESILERFMGNLGNQEVGPHRGLTAPDSSSANSTVQRETSNFGKQDQSRPDSEAGGPGQFIAKVPETGQEASGGKEAAIKPGEAEDIEEVEAVGELEEADEVEELGDAEDVGKPDVSDSPQDVEELEELGEAEDLEAADEPDEAEELEKVEVLEEADEPQEAEAVGELEEADEVEELGDVEDAEEADEPEKAEAVGELEEVEELGEAEELEAGDELDEGEELEEVEEVEALEESDELEEAEAIGELEEIDEAEEIEEVEALGDVDEGEELQQVEELGDQPDEGLVQLGSDPTVGQTETGESSSKGVVDNNQSAVGRPEQRYDPAQEFMTVSIEDEIAAIFTEQEKQSVGVDEGPVSSERVSMASPSEPTIEIHGGVTFGASDLKRIFGEPAVVTRDDGVLTIDESVYGGPGHGGSAPGRSENLGHSEKLGEPANRQEANGVEVFTSSSDEEVLYLGEVSLEPVGGGRRRRRGASPTPTGAATENVPGASEEPKGEIVSSAGIDFDKFLRRFRSDDAGVVRALVFFTRRVNAKLAFIMVAAGEGFRGEFSLGIEEGAVRRISVPGGSDLAEGILGRRCVFLFERPLSELPGLEFDVDARAFASFKRSLFLPVNFRRKQAYLVLGLQPGGDEAEMLLQKIKTVLNEG